MKFKECLEKFNVEKATELMKHGKTQAYIGLQKLPYRW